MQTLLISPETAANIAQDEGFTLLPTLNEYLLQTGAKLIKRPSGNFLIYGYHPHNKDVTYYENRYPTLNNDSLFSSRLDLSTSLNC